jgi:hypothetical protein
MGGHGQGAEYPLYTNADPNHQDGAERCVLVHWHVGGVRGSLTIAPWHSVPERATVLMEHHFVSFAVRPIPVGVAFRVQAMVVALKFTGDDLRLYVNGKQDAVADTSIGFIKGAR